MRRALLGLLRLGASIAILWLLFYKVGVSATIDRVATLDLRALCAATALVLLTMVLHAKRWLLVLSAGGYTWSLRDALREMWIGYFFNQLLPSSVGGDGVRALRLYRSGVPMATSVRAVLTERVYGFIACSMLGVIAVPVMLSVAPRAPATIAVCLTVALGVVGALLLWWIHAPAFRFLPKRVLHELQQLGGALRNRNCRAQAMAVSVAMQLAIAASIAALSMGLDLPANPLLVALLYQPIALMTLIPISMAGWGVRESALVAVLAVIGVPDAYSLTLSLCFGAIVLFASLPGWYFLAAGRMMGPRRLEHGASATP